MASPTLSRHRTTGSHRNAAVPHTRSSSGPPSPARRAAPPEGPAGPVGRYRFHLSSGSWWWSPEMLGLHRIAAGTVDPSLELLLGHQHPEDRARVAAALAGACQEGRSFCLQVRLCREGAQPRSAVLLGEPEVDETGAVVAVSGALAEFTDPADHADGAALESEIEQLRTAMASRAPIEQAKGIVMLLTGCGEEVAFRLLAHISSHTHRKVRDVAVAITESASGHSRLPEDVRVILRDACPPGGGMR